MVLFSLGILTITFSFQRPLEVNRGPALEGTDPSWVSQHTERLRWASEHYIYTDIDIYTHRSIAFSPVMKSGLLLILSFKQMVNKRKRQLGQTDAAQLSECGAQHTEYPKFEH